MDKKIEATGDVDTGKSGWGKSGWVTPEITTYLPAKAAEGINYRPGDGLSNLTP